MLENEDDDADNNELIEDLYAYIESLKTKDIKYY